MPNAPEGRRRIHGAGGVDLAQVNRSSGQRERDMAAVRKCARTGDIIKEISTRMAISCDAIRGKAAHSGLADSQNDDPHVHRLVLAS